MKLTREFIKKAEEIGAFCMDVGVTQNMTFQDMKAQFKNDGLKVYEDDGLDVYKMGLGKPKNKGAEDMATTIANAYKGQLSHV